MSKIINLWRSWLSYKLSAYDSNYKLANIWLNMRALCCGPSINFNGEVLLWLMLRIPMILCLITRSLI